MKRIVAIIVAVAFLTAIAPRKAHAGMRTNPLTGAREAFVLGLPGAGRNPPPGPKPEPDTRWAPVAR